MPPLPTGNSYQAVSSPAKLRGEFYTPPELVRLMLDALSLTPRHLVVDPSCGDGSFLRGAVAALARRFPETDPAHLAEQWSQRLIGFDIHASAVLNAREALSAAFREHLGAT